MSKLVKIGVNGCKVCPFFKHISNVRSVPICGLSEKKLLTTVDYTNYIDEDCQLEEYKE